MRVSFQMKERRCKIIDSLICIFNVANIVFLYVILLIKYELVLILG